MKTGKTPVLDGKEWRTLLESIPTETLRDLRDRALIATLTYSFARITAALRMKVEDLRPKGAGWQVQLHEKGGKQHAMPCHHSLAEILRAYIGAAGIAGDRKGWLFRTSPGHNGMALVDAPMSQADAWRMIRRRAVAAGIHAPIGNHTFRATGIIAYLGNGGSVAGFRARCGTGRICPTQAEGGAAVGWRKQFKGRQFADEVILWAVRWYLMFPISYPDLELMLLDRGVDVGSHLEVRNRYQGLGEGS